MFRIIWWVLWHRIRGIRQRKGMYGLAETRKSEWRNLNETDINPPAELGRLADASGDKQSTRISPVV